MLVTKCDAFEKWSYNEAFKTVFRDGLLGSEEPLHRRMHRIVRPVLGRDRLAGYARHMVDITTPWVAGWHEGEIDLAREFSLLTLEIASQCLFSVSLAGAAEEIYAATSQIQRLSDRHGVLPEEEHAYERMVATIYRVVSELRAERRRSGLTDDDLLHLLFAAQDADPAGVTDASIHEELVTFLLASHMTIAATLAAACWLLARQPDVQTALRRELATVLDGRPPTLADLPALKLCEGVFLESLRLYPPVWSFGRQAVRDVSLGGRLLPAGSRVVICPWVLHRDARCFAEPDAFQPLRWENGLRDTLPANAFLPFSIGPRACLGERFAALEAPLVLASVIQRWAFSELPGGTDPAWSPQIILWPRRGVRLRATSVFST